MHLQTLPSGRVGLIIYEKCTYYDLFVKMISFRYILRKDRKKMDEQKEDEITIEELVEKEVVFQIFELLIFRSF